jgi:phosphate acetyltransferase
MNAAIYKAKTAIHGKQLRLVLPEGEDDRIRAAARELEAQDLAVVNLLESVLPPSTEEQSCAILAQRPSLTPPIIERLLRKPLYFAGAMLAAGNADAMIAGATHATARVIEAGLLTIGLAEGVTTPSSFFLMQWPDRQLIFADCAVNIQPTASELAAIAIASAASATKLLDEPPRVALLSFSTKGSGHHADADKVIEALRITREVNANLIIDGELQGDAALSASVAARKVKAPSDVAGRANVLIFPDLDAGNIAYKLVDQLSNCQAIGPVLQGFAKPISDLSRGATVEDIIDTAALLLSMSLANGR